MILPVDKSYIDFGATCGRLTGRKTKYFDKLSTGDRKEHRFGIVLVSKPFEKASGKISYFHIAYRDFALKDGLLPLHLAKGRIAEQFSVLVELAEINVTLYRELFVSILSETPKVEKLIASSFLDETTKRSCLQSYQNRLRQLTKMND